MMPIIVHPLCSGRPFYKIAADELMKDTGHERLVGKTFLDCP